VAPPIEDVDTTRCRQDFTIESRRLERLRSQFTIALGAVCVSLDSRQGARGERSAEEVVEMLELVN
jgi:hypothetical protein